MMESKWSGSPHRRFNPLSRRWVLVSPQRTERPWQGEISNRENLPAIHYDPDCYLCPGNTRAGGRRNPNYEGAFVFDNDYAALLPDSPVFTDAPHDDLFCAERERGICRVVCFHPDHDLTLARMDLHAVERVVETWVAQYEELERLPEIGYVQIFENRGAMMGASNPHPHCQIWATEHIPDEPAAELTAQREYRAKHGSCLLCDYLMQELAASERIVCENEEFVALVPFWAVWPFETMIVNRRHAGSLTGMDSVQHAGFADILKRTATRYDNLFQTNFPYTMGLHPCPADGEPHPEWHFHTHFYPPLLRSATVRKFMVGFEMLGMAQRDITPERAAERLRATREIHYKTGSIKGERE